MTVRREIAEPRRETGVRSRKDLGVLVCEGPSGESAGRRPVGGADQQLQQKCS
jgi:hypothetical protein